MLSCLLLSKYKMVVYVFLIDLTLMALADESVRRSVSSLHQKALVLLGNVVLRGNVYIFNFGAIRSGLQSV